MPEYRISFEQIRDEVTSARDSAAEILERLERLLHSIENESGPEELDFDHTAR